MKRYPVTVLLAPASIYVHAAREAQGYAPAPDARFAVVRDQALPDGQWVLVHRRTGAKIESLLPARSRKLTMTDKLAVAAALYAATHLDWSPFDALPQTTHETKGVPAFADREKAEKVATEMRAIVAHVLS